MKPILSLFIGGMLIAPALVWGQTAEADKAPVPTQTVATDGAAATPQAAAAPENTATATAPVAAQEPAAATQNTQPQPSSAAPESAPATQEQQALEKDLAQANAEEAQPKEDFVAARETVEEEFPEPEEEQVVVYNPKTQRDPTLSPDDFLLIQHREQQRLAAIEAERQRKLEEERRKKEEAERLRRLELERIKDPTREVRNKIRIGGVIGQEVFIGSKIYTIGNTIYGARIVAVKPDEVVFSYKGHKFVRKVQL